MRRYLSDSFGILTVVLAALVVPPVRGAEGPSPDADLERLRSWDQGDDDAPLHRLVKWVEESTNDASERARAAEKLASVVADRSASLQARSFACARLRLVGTAAQVPGLASLLADAKTVEMARSALEAIPGDEASAALRDALGTLGGPELAGVVGSVGSRRDPLAIDALAKHIAAVDDSLAMATAWALGRIGTKDAARILSGALPDARGKRIEALREAQLACAESLIAAGERDAASELFDEVWKAGPGPSQRAGALRGLAEAEGSAALPLLVEASVSGDEVLRGQAIRLLVDLKGKEVTAALVRETEAAAADRRTVLLEILTERGDAGAGELASRLAAKGETTVRVAALRALGAVGRSSDVPMLALFAATEAGDVGEAAHSSLVALRAPGVDEALLRALRSARDGSVRPELMRACATRRTPGAEAALLELFQAPGDDEIRLAAAEAAVRLAEATGGDEDTDRALAALRRSARGPEDKRIILEALSRATTVAAAKAVLALLGEQGIEGAAGEAVLRLSRTMLRTRPREAAEVLHRLLESSPEASVAAEATRLAGEAERAAIPQGEEPELRPDPERTRAQKRDLARRAPAGFRLAAYLDCGPDTEDGRAGRAGLQLLSGQPYLWEGAAGVAPPRQATVAFDAQEVLFLAAGLDAARSYLLGFSWWDYDRNGRIESVWAMTGDGGRRTRLIEKARLPAYVETMEPPEERSVALPKDLCAGGEVRIGFSNDRGPNAVVSELWLWETLAAGAAREPESKPEKGRKEARIVIITGNDYPGHKWRETAPVLRRQLQADPRLDVDLVEDPMLLASPKLREYRSVVLHWMNWETPDPGPEARENLRSFVDGGGGLVIVHFACGAFQDWPEFRNLAGRSYDPALRGHDPHGKFTVNIAKSDHPITRGLKDFETTDELYTCLAGDRPIEILATARSKVDGKDYPMAFAFTYGKGRVFHSPLGHDVAAIENPSVGELFRRGCSWTAGLDPTPGESGK